MLSLRGVSAWIEVDGVELRQYGTEEDLDQNRATCWIAAEAGKNFSVVFRDDAARRQDSLTSSLEFDGTQVIGSILRPIFESTSSRTVVQRDELLSATLKRPFMFSKLELTDDDKYLHKSSTNLGEICIRIYRSKAISRGMIEALSSVASTHDKVHERSKKAITHCVSYGKQVTTATQYGWYLELLDGNTPLATFTFKYRDPGLLQANDIMPKPFPAKKRRVSAEEVIDLVTCDHVKSEPPNDEIEIVDGPSSSKSSSSKKQVRPKKKIKLEEILFSGEVIDLT